MNTTQTVVFAILVILLIIFGPLITIWALNTLFPLLMIPYTFWTWLSTLILQGLFYGKSQSSD